MGRIFRPEEEKLETEHLLRGLAVGFIALLVLAPLAFFVPIFGFNLFLALVVVPYYAGYLAGKRTDEGVAVGIVLGILWTGVEILILFMVGNMFAMTGRARIQSMFEAVLLLVVFASNTFFCAYGGRVGTQKRFLHRSKS